MSTESFGVRSAFRPFLKGAGSAMSVTPCVSALLAYSKRTRPESFAPRSWSQLCQGQGLSIRRYVRRGLQLGSVPSRDAPVFLRLRSAPVTEPFIDGRARGVGDCAGLNQPENTGVVGNL